MHRTVSELARRRWFWLSVTINLGFLGIFKYYNFFIESFSNLLTPFGLRADLGTLSIILPVGISFYTFHGLSYVIDIYKKRIAAETNFVDYALFVSFFPLLVAGPIERATHLLPQLKRERQFKYHRAVDGLRQILWGLFKKIVIADNCASYVNMVFANSDQHTGSTLLLGAFFFAFQIYGDFSGYSDIALGTARLFGIELIQNFSFPYFSRDIAEFWRRWHISLSTWFRDYLYIPLGGSKGGMWMKVRNTFIIFIVSGFWHGANWTFVVWGTLNAIYFLPLLLTNQNRTNLGTVAQGRSLPSIREAGAMLSTFGLTCVAWIFFRADNIDHAIRYVSEIASPSLFTAPDFARKGGVLIMIVLFIVIEWQGREQKYAIEAIGTTWRRPVRWFAYYVMLLVIVWFGGKEQEFIYFQF